jgi:hypothetical protein
VVRTRILIAVGAWLLGAVTATGASLLAVSQLGQGIVDTTGQQLTVSAVNSALAREQGEQATAAPRAERPAGAAQPAADAPHHSAASTPPSQAPSPPPGTLFASPGGTVVADCQPAGAYLLTWSPQQGFEAQNVVRGPAAVVSVLFATQASGVTVQVACRGGVPTVLQSSWSGGGGDGGGE